MTERGEELLIIGAGHAGGTLAGALRQAGWTGGITLVGAEPQLPYQRPPLSKAWLQGTADSHSLLLRSRKFYAEQNITLHLGDAATHLDPDARHATLASGTRLPFDRLVLATGASPRRLPVAGADLGGVQYLRTVADADQLKEGLASARHIAVIGGGYLGLEVAASARMLGLEATIIEREARLLARVASAEVSAFYHAFHRARGIAIELGAGVRQLLGADGRVRAVELADGREIAAELVLVSIGASPEDGLARQLGCACADGIVVDADCRTSVANVYAIGDATRRPLPVYGAHVARMESVPSAVEQTRQLAHHLTGKAPPVAEVPWFWSDQFDLKLQIAGLPLDTARRIVRGNPADNRFAVFHLNAASQVQAVEAINMPAEFMFGKKLIGSRAAVHPGRVADASVAVREIVG